MGELSIFYLGDLLLKIPFTKELTFKEIREKVMGIESCFSSDPFQIYHLNKPIMEEEALVSSYIRDSKEKLVIEPVIEPIMEPKILPNNQFGAFAKKKLPSNTVVFIIDPVHALLSEPTMYSIQVGENLHADLDDIKYGRYLNHSCDPTVLIKHTIVDYITKEGIRSQKDKLYVITTRDIIEGEQLTFNYLFNEYEMAQPFNCECYTTKCFKKIGGYKYLSDDEKSLIRPFISPHLLKLESKSAQTIKHSYKSIDSL